MKKKIIAIVAILALVAILGTVLVACNNEKDFRKRLQEAGYELMSKDNMERMMSETPEDNEDWDSIEWIVGGVKFSLLSIATENYDMVLVVKFKNNDKAQEFYEEMQKNNDEEDNLIVERQGKIVFYGTKQGIKDAQGK